MRIKTKILGFLLLCSALFPVVVAAQNNDKESSQDPLIVVSELYELVTFKAGETPDWNKVRSLFLNEALIVLRTSRDSSTIFSLEGFVEDFVNFIEKSKVKETGFIEKIIKVESFILADIAHFLVVYEVSIPGTKFKPQKGLDSFHLVKRKEGWKIVSIINEVPTEKNPFPERLK